MKTLSTGFIGGGRVIKIFLRAWQNASAMPERVMVTDTCGDVVFKLSEVFPSIEISTDVKSVAS